MAPDYESILALRTMQDAVRRGYLFEAAMRENFPWTFRPPLAVVGDAEQLDAFFEWNSWHFLIEAKAKKDTIQAGSHDWEDFALKLMKRSGQCIGLFCSLGPVAPGIEQAATDLNKRGLTTLILAGPVWDELNETGLGLGDLLRFMVAQARSKYLPSPPALRKVRDYAYDVAESRREIRTFCRAQSATFLRRHRLPRHSDVYVPRSVDAQIAAFAQALKPSALDRASRARQRDEQSYQAARIRPAQLLVIRDASGAGKTTSLVELALRSKEFHGLARAALEPETDDLTKTMQKLGDDYGLAKLRAVNEPLVVAVDSLDEAAHISHKQGEINGLIRSVEDDLNGEDLNSTARAAGMLAFPIGLVFTVREDYWERWNAFFDGRNTIMLLQRLSHFTVGELDSALAKYAHAYSFQLPKVPLEARRVLEVPFNLQVFSEANEYRGVLSGDAVDEILNQDVLTLYFERKREEILKRHTSGLSGKLAISALANVAMELTAQNRSEIAWERVEEIVIDTDPLQRANVDQITRALISDQLLTPSSEDHRQLRIRHSRFQEYLVAYHICHQVSRGEGTAFLDATTTQVFKATSISMFRVHKLVLHICERYFPERLGIVTEFYASSSEYMTRNLLHLRGRLGKGKATEQSTIGLILQAGAIADPDVSWDSFFVIAARLNEQPEGMILEAFEKAWVTNSTRSDRWKLIDKLGALKLTTSETALKAVVSSRDPKEWEVYLGFILEGGEQALCRSMFTEIGFDETILPSDAPEWMQTHWLLGAVLHDRDYVRGESVAI